MKPLLVVIDVQNGFLGSRSQHVVDPIVRLLSGWHGSTAFTQFVSLPGGQYERLIGWKRLQAPPEIDLHAQIAPYARRVFTKNYYSAFTEEFSQFVASGGFDTLFLCGVATDSCVLKTAVDAFERGYRPYVLADACASHGGEVAHNAAIFLLQRFIGKAQVGSIAEAQLIDA